MSDNHPAAVFLQMVYQPSDILEFRLIKEGGPAKSLWSTLEEFSSHIPRITQMNDDGYSVYYGANPRKAIGGTKAADVEIARGWFVDMDGGATADALRKACVDAGYIAPAIIINSGGGVQGIWRSSKPVPIAQWLKQQRAITEKIAGVDASVKDAPRVMRLPGFVNRKGKYAPDHPTAEIVCISPEDFHPEDFPESETSAAFAVNDDDGPEILAIDTTGVLPRYAEDFLESGKLIQPEGKGQPSRRETAFRVAIEMKAASIPQEEASSRICDALERLGLDDVAVEDFRNRQIANAYSEARTPTIDKDRLPTVTGVRDVEFSAQHAADGKYRITVKRGLRKFVDVIDCSKLIARTRFTNAAMRALADESVEKAVSDYLMAVAVEEIKPDDTDDVGPVQEQEYTRDSFVDTSHVISPEAFTITDGADWKSGITVPKFVDVGGGELAGRWITITNDSEGNRQMIDLPPSFTVGESVFRVYPKVPPPGFKGSTPPWSDESMWAFLEDGKPSIPAGELVDAIGAEFDKFLFFDESVREGYLTTLALWVIHTYMTHRFSVVPYILINGIAGSGKGRVMNCIKQLVFRCYLITSPSPAAIYRHIHFEGGTVLCDEAERLANSDLSAGTLDVLLASNTRGVPVPRCEGEDNKITNFDPFSPKAFISINHPTKALLERSIQIMMFRAPKGLAEAMDHPSDEFYQPYWARLRDGLHTFALSYAGEFLEMPSGHDVTPRDMMSRQREVWGPLLRIAAVMDRIAGTSHLKTLTDLIAIVASDSEMQAVTETDERLLKALWKLHTLGKDTSPKAVLAQAYADGLSTDDKISEKMVAQTLRNYGFKTWGGGGKRRRWFRVDRQKMEAVAANYCIQIEMGENIAPGVPPYDTSNVSDVSDFHSGYAEIQKTLPGGNKSDTYDTSDVSYRGAPPPKYSPDVSENGKATGEVEL